MKAGGLQLPQVQLDVNILGGGLDQVTPILLLKPGSVIDAQNFECSVNGGYTRSSGYERFDGRTSPSQAGYLAITANITDAIAVGNVLTGVTSGATGTVILVDGSTVLLSKVTGNFVVGETLNVGGLPKATLTTFGTTSDITAQLDATYIALASDLYRADIGAVPGSGPIRGVVRFGGTVYAWRNNAGATALAMYKSSPAGWQAVPLGFQLSFTVGLAAGIVDGDTVTGLTSGATGVVKRVVVQSGSFGAGTAAGRLIFAAVVGNFQAAETLRVAGTNRATCSGVQTAITLLPGGRVETDMGNVAGGVAGNRIYGCDGVNRGFEFDGTTYVPIVTGMAADTPNHVRVHKSHVFFMFGPSVQFSGLGLPYFWSPVVGAGEIALSENGTAMQSLPGDQTTAALGIYTESSKSILYGSSSADFNLVQFPDAGGAKAYSVQKLSDSYCFDANGISSLRASVAYGNFGSAALSLRQRPFVQQRRGLVTASAINREKSQYCVFFTDGYGLCATIVNGKLAGIMPVNFPNPINCACEGERDDEQETIFFGSTDGFVYRLGVGRSFDGAEIDAYMTIAWQSMKNPRVLKAFQRGSIEIVGNSYAAFGLSYQLAYGNESGEEVTIETLSSSSSRWDEATWDEFVWDGRSLSPSEFDLEGSAENIAIRIDCNSKIMLPFTMNSIIIHYTNRRFVR